MLSLLLVTTLAATAPAQKPDEPVAFNVMVLGLFATDDPALTKELGLSDDQVKGLQEHRKKWLADYHKLDFSARYTKLGELSEANDKALAKILTDKQLPLLRKRLLWESCLRFGEFRTLRYPDVAKELGLNEQQLTKLQAGESAGEVLTDDQKKKWNDVRGPRPAELLKLASPSETRPPLAEVNPERLMLLVLPGIQEDLKLTDKQRSTIDQQAQKWVKESPFVLFGKPEQLKALIDPVEKALDDALDEGQRKRLAQIRKQKAISHSPGLFWVAAFANESFQKEIALTSEQKHKVENLDTAHLKAVIKAASKAETVDEALATVRKLSLDRQEELLKLLEPDQKKKVEDLYGKPFNRRFPYVGRNSLLPDEYPPARPPLLLLLQELTTSDSLVKELDLSKETRDELIKLANEVQRVPVKGETPAQQHENRQQAYREYVKQMATILGKEKTERATQILLQLIANPPEGIQDYHGRVLAHWPEMIRDLGLTAEQIDLLYATTNVRDVLTPDQINKFEKRLGEPHKVTLKRTESPPAVFGRSAQTFLLKHPAVRKELNLTEEQQQKLLAWLDDYRETSHRSSYWRDATRMEKARKQLNEQLDALLKEPQRARLRQIERQISVREGGLLALFGEAEFLKALAPTEDEKEKLLQLKYQRVRVYNAISRYLTSGGTRKQSDEDLPVLRELHAGDLQRVEKALGEATAGRLKAFLGEPFDGVTEWVFLAVFQEAFADFAFIEFGPPY